MRQQQQQQMSNAHVHTIMVTPELVAVVPMLPEVTSKLLKSDRDEESDKSLFVVEIAHSPFKLETIVSCFVW